MLASKRKQRISGNRHANGHSSPRLTTELDVRIGVFRQPAMQTPVLVLNASYEPINICGARRALVLVLKGVARTEEEQGAILHAAASLIGRPAPDPGAPACFLRTRPALGRRSGYAGTTLRAPEWAGPPAPEATARREISREPVHAPDRCHR